MHLLIYSNIIFSLVSSQAEVKNIETISKMPIAAISAFCRAKDKDMNDVCRFYVDGVVDGIKVSQDLSYNTGGVKQICIPENVNGDEIVDELIRIPYSEIPHEDRFPATAFFIHLLSKQYPCPKP